MSNSGRRQKGPTKGIINDCIRADGDFFWKTNELEVRIKTIDYNRL